MAGRREILEQRRLPRDGDRGLPSHMETLGDSVHGTTNNRNVYQDGRTETNTLGALATKDDAGNPSSTSHILNTTTPMNASHARNYYHEEQQQAPTSRSVFEQSSQGHREQGAAQIQMRQNQNLPERSASQDLPGLIPPREIDTRPPDSEAGDGTQNYRRMAVCQETDDAQSERRKMRVYMKRF